MKRRATAACGEPGRSSTPLAPQVAKRARPTASPPAPPAAKKARPDPAPSAPPASQTTTSEPPAPRDSTVEQETPRPERPCKLPRSKKSKKDEVPKDMPATSAEPAPDSTPAGSTEPAPEAVPESSAARSPSPPPPRREDTLVAPPPPSPPLPPSPVLETDPSASAPTPTAPEQGNSSRELIVRSLSSRDADVEASAEEVIEEVDRVPPPPPDSRTNDEALRICQTDPSNPEKVLREIDDVKEAAEWAEVAGLITSLREELPELLKALRRSTNQVNTRLRPKMESLAKQSRDKSEYLLEKLPVFDQRAKSKVEWDNLKGQLSVVQQDLATRNSQVASLKEDLIKEAARAKAVEDEVSRLKEESTEVAQLKQNLEELKTQLQGHNKLRTIAAKLKEDLTEAKVQVKKLEGEKATIESLVTKAQEDAAATNSQRLVVFNAAQGLKVAAVRACEAVLNTPIGVDDT